MLSEAFVRVLSFREERKSVQTPAVYRHAAATHTLPDRAFCETQLDPDTDPDTDLSAGTGGLAEWLGLSQGVGMGVKPQPATALSIPSCIPVVPPYSQTSICLASSSLLQQYPDLRLAQNQEGQDTSNSQEGSPDPGHSLLSQAPPESEYPLHSRSPDNQESQGDLGASMPDQGYLVMGASVVPSLGVLGAGREPLSNSLLNGMLEKKLDEVYLQHLTDSLANCGSMPGCSLLRGLVPPPQPDLQPQGSDSLQGEELEEQSDVISYLSTHNTNFSSPVLRISDTGDTHRPAPQ